MADFAVAGVGASNTVDPWAGGSDDTSFWLARLYIRGPALPVASAVADRDDVGFFAPDEADP